VPDEQRKMKDVNIVSFGVGQNSTAMILLMKQKGIKIDNVIFADTGNEMPQTYTFLEIFKAWLKTNNIPFTTVKSHLYPLRQYYYERNIIPYRMFRSCTDRFKIRPINKYTKENYKDCFINMYMGIGSDEVKRAKETTRKNQTMKYPLIDYEIDRAKCIEIIKKEGLPIPVKSGCYFCPFQSKMSWLKLLEDYPDLFDDSILFEENCRAFPESTFTNIPLRKLREIAINQTKLNKFINKKEIGLDKCCYCHL